MTRPARLTIGVLLLGLGGFLFTIQDQAAFPEVIGVLVYLFGVPGLLLLASGLLPGRAAADDLRMLFIPSRLLGGLGLSAAGIALLLAGGQFLHLAPRFLLLFAFSAVPIGLLVAGSCWTLACRGCETPLEEVRSEFQSDAGPRLRQAVTAGAAPELLTLREAAAPGGPLTVTFQYCPRCRRIGLLEGPGGSSSVVVAEWVPRLVAAFSTARRDRP